MCGCVTAYNGDGVLANVFKPDELEGAGAEAVDSLHLVLANDYVAERSTRLEQEHRVRVPSLAVPASATASVVLNPPGIEHLARRNPLWRR